MSDPERWHFLLQIPGLCRVMFPVAPHESDELAVSGDFAQSLMATVVPGVSNYDVAHVTLYKVHQRVAKTFQCGRAFLAGDAAHINNPLGGMGMNGGIHDAVNVAEKLVEIIRKGADDSLLDLYDRQRRPIAVEYVQAQSIRNKKMMEERDPAVRAERQAELRAVADDRDKTIALLRQTSMVNAVEKSATLI